MTVVLPIGGPKTPLRRFSSFESTMSCDWLAEVCAEKLRKIDAHLSLGRLSTYFWT